jgi:hypothetical protein
MIEQLKNLKEPLSELASVLNAFKSEAVQLKLLEFILDGATTRKEPPPEEEKTQRKSAQHRKSGREPMGSAAQARGKGPRGGTGPSATLNELVEGNFFDKAHTINDIMTHCKHNLARTFKANELSGKLTHLVRVGGLERAKNADHQYEYKKP